MMLKWLNKKAYNKGRDDGYKEGVKAARDAVATTWVAIQGTPYITGPNKFCKAIDEEC